MLEASSDEEGSFNDDEKDPDVTMYGVKKQKIKREAPPLPNPFMMRELCYLLLFSLKSDHQFFSSKMLSNCSLQHNRTSWLKNQQ